MRIFLLSISFLCTCVASNALVNEHPNDPVQAATELLQRVLPHAKQYFTLELLHSTDNAAAMQLDSCDGKVVLRGTGGVELASALNWYMNDYLNATYDWNTYAEGQLPELTGAVPSAGDPLPLPLPATSAVKPRQVGPQPTIMLLLATISIMTVGLILALPVGYTYQFVTTKTIVQIIFQCSHHPWAGAVVILYECLHLRIQPSICAVGVLGAAYRLDGNAGKQEKSFAMAILCIDNV